MEYPIFPYYVDFAFVDLKLAIEIDGSQHLEEERKQSDERKDVLLTEQGWKVVRITATKVMYEIDEVWELLNDILSNYDKVDSVTNIGLHKNHGKVYKRVERDENGYSEKQKQSFIKSRKVADRPSREELLYLLLKNPFIAVADMYDVSDNAVRKWCEDYNIPSRRTEIDEFKSRLIDFLLTDVKDLSVLSFYLDNIW